MQSTQSCLSEIQSLTHETSSEKRRQVLNRVTDLFFLTSNQQSDDDVSAFGNVMERIAYELEVEARAELADRISEIDKAPRNLVTRLAQDDISVARPVLEKSRVLTDDDLIHIAKTRGQTHLHAISRRPTLASPVTDIIVERGESEVLVEVTRNKGAEFSQNGLGTLAEKARSDGNLLHALGSRADLPDELMAEIKQRVAEKIKTEMAGKYTAEDMADVDTLIDESAAGLDLNSFKKSNDALQQRANDHALTEADILQLAKSRRLADLVHALSVLTGLDDRMISHCLLKADISAIGIICKSKGFAGTTYLALIQTRLGQNGIAARDIARAMKEYETLGVENANRTLRYLKVRGTLREDNAQPQLQQGTLWQAHQETNG